MAFGPKNTRPAHACYRTTDPRTRWPWRGLFDNVDELDAYRAALGDKAAEQFVQERLDYRLGTLYQAAAIFDGSGRRLAFFMSRSIRTTYSWGGPALGVVPVAEPRLAELALIVMEATGPHYGVVHVEFIFDAKRGDFVFIEVNPRYWGAAYLATAAGINFPDIVVRMAMGEDWRRQVGIVGMS